ncbi:MAG: signal transduction histidine kinase/ActR/RegA family two-component response regulator [Planctomycetota bacterium]
MPNTSIHIGHLTAQSCPGHRLLENPPLAIAGLLDPAPVAGLLIGALTVGVAWWLSQRSNKRLDHSPTAPEYTLTPPTPRGGGVQAAQVGLWVWEPEQERHWWSSDLYKLIDVPPSVPADLAVLLQAVHPADESALLATLERARCHHGQGHCEVRFQVNGMQRRMSLEFAERPGPEGSGPRIVGSLHDVTDQVTAVQVERQRAEREQRFEAAMLHAVRLEEVLLADTPRAAQRLCATAVQMLDCQAVSFWSMNKSKSALAKVAGVPECSETPPLWTWKSLKLDAQPKSLVFDKLHSPETRDQVGPALHVDSTSCLLVPSNASGQQIGTLRLERADNSEWSEDEKRFASELAKLLAQVTVVAENKLLEEQLRQSQKMESVGQLAGAIAHDFNNMLTSILGYSELLSGEIPSDSPLQADIKEIVNSGESAKSLTRQLLAFSRLQPMDQTTVQLNVLVATMEKMLRLMFDERIELHQDLQASTSLVRVDVALIEQVVLNLVLNSRDAMPSGGNIWLRTHLERPALGAPGESIVVLSISDDGSGIPTEAQDRIFEPFFTTKDKHKGSGLGLSTAYGIIKQSCGELALVSTSARGTTFEIRLPLHVGREEAETVVLNTSTGGAIRGETILVVEDEMSVLNLAIRALTEAGYDVLEASCGDEALEVSAGYDGPIHLLLSDVVMPGLSGGETADRLLATRPELAIVFMSGFNDDPQVREAIDKHHADYLRKPFTPSELSTHVSRALVRASDNTEPHQMPPLGAKNST